MPRPKREPYIFRIPGRKGYYAFIDRVNKNVSLGTENEEEAISRLAALLDNRRIQQFSPNEKTLAEIFKDCYARAEVNHTRKTTYEYGLNTQRILAWVEETTKNSSAKQVNAALVERYKAFRIESGVSAARVNRELDSWKKAMKVAVEYKVCHPSVLEAFIKIREPRPQPHQIGVTKDDIGAFLDAVQDERYKALFRMVLGCAIRDDEARHIDESDIQDPYIVVTPKKPGACSCCPKGWTVKNYHYRSIPVSDTTLEVARVFVREKPTMNLNHKAVYRRFQKARIAASLTKHFSMHDLRRSWASHMLAAGHKIEHISRWLGHGDILTTMRYLKIVEIDLPPKESLPF